MFDVVRYNSSFRDAWDNLVRYSKNGTFLFSRDYMEYHSDRFQDLSFLAFKNGVVKALIPGNKNSDVFFSHQGLTYGGIIMSPELVTTDVINIFHLFNARLIEFGIKEVIYKPVPYIYHKMPAQEDIYVLHLLHAEKTGCHIASVIRHSARIKFRESRLSGIRKSIKAGLITEPSDDFMGFWDLLTGNLVRTYNIKPVHSLEEISILKSRFPENIRLYVARHNGEIVAGTVIYLTDNVAHVQYISANDSGKRLGALDLLFNELITNDFAGVPFFDFGSSSEQMGNYLNEKLIFQKEGFGGRGIVYETYKYFI